MEKAYLVLEDGTVFPGESVGADAEATGELVFTTGMVGYLETITDPSYCGQIVLQTFPMIGNYGLIPSDFEGKPALKGYVVHELCGHPSNFRSEGLLRDYLKEAGIPAIAGVDTRGLTRRIREQGVMNARICRELPENLEAIRAFRITGAVDQVTRTAAEIFPPKGEKRFSVTLIDYGAKRNISRELIRRGCEVTVVPARTPAEESSSRIAGITLYVGIGRVISLVITAIFSPGFTISLRRGVPMGAPRALRTSSVPTSPVFTGFA